MNTSRQLPPRAHVTSGCSERPLQVTRMTSFAHHSRLSSLFFFFPTIHSLWLPPTENGHREMRSPGPPSGSWLQRKGKQSHSERKLPECLSGLLSSPCLMPVVGNEAPHSLVPEPARLPTAARFTCTEKPVLWSSALLVLFYPPEHQQFHTGLYFHNRLD